MSEQMKLEDFETADKKTDVSESDSAVDKSVEWTDTQIDEVKRKKHQRDVLELEKISNSKIDDEIKPQSVWEDTREMREACLGLEHEMMRLGWKRDEHPEWKVGHKRECIICGSREICRGMSEGYDKGF